MVCIKATIPKIILKNKTPLKLPKSNKLADTIIANKLIKISAMGDIAQPLELYKLKTMPPNNPIQLLSILKSSSNGNPL